MFIANLSFAGPVYDEAGPSYDSDMLSKYEQDNEEQVVQSDVSSVPNDAVMMITSDIYKQDAQCVTSNKPNNTVNASLTAELARYKELAKVYEKRAQFELTERELMIDTQMRMIIKDHNFKEESLQKELHYVKMQLNSTINHNKLIREEVSTLKHDFKQKENKLLEEFLDMRQLKEKAKALKEKAKSTKPIAALTVYHPNTPGKLVPKVLPTKIQVQNKDLTVKVNALQDLNERFRAENEKFKQHYKELYDSLKLTHAKTIEKTTSLLDEIENLKAQLKGKMKCVTMPAEKPKVLAPRMYAIDVEPIPPRNRNNREVHLDYLTHLKESVGTLCEIVEEARITQPLDYALEYACRYAKHSQELLEYAFVTCPQDVIKRDKKIDRVLDATAASRSNPKTNTKKVRTLPAKSDKKNIEVHPRNNQSSMKRSNRIDSSIISKRTVINSNSNSVCKTCNKCLMSFNHDKCVVKSMKFVKKSPVNKVWRVKQVWQATGKLFANVSHQWMPTGRKFTLGVQCPLTRFTQSKVVLVTQPENVSTSEIVITERLSNTSQKPLNGYQHKNKHETTISTDTPITDVTQSIDDSVKPIVCPTDFLVVFRLRLLKTYDGESLMALEFPIYFGLQPAFQSEENMSPKRQLFLTASN
ncbi:hypothetical protein Tco_0103123 [Tanacetum coccineum]